MVFIHRASLNDCGCWIHRDPGGCHTINYCSKHAAAPALYAVCKKALASEVDGSYVVAAKWWEEMQAALSLADGKEG